jgi:hypothetical protein
VATGEPETFRPRRFADLEQVGEAFRSGSVVDPLLEDASEDLARRLIDYSSGMVFIAGGTMKKIGPRTFRLDPTRAERPPDRGTAGDRHPRQPRPTAGAGAAALSVTHSE